MRFGDAGRNRESANPAASIANGLNQLTSIGEPLVTYEGSGLTNRRFHHADERGSIVALSDSSGAMVAINTFDEFGKPGAGNVGRFQYTGQAWLPEVKLHYYKARMYASHLGRFLQTDPIGYGPSPNLYAYVGNDPVNFIDPLGLEDKEIIVSACGAGTYKNSEGTCVRLAEPNTSRNPGMLASTLIGPMGGAAAQQTQCQTPQFKRILSNPKVKDQVGNALEEAVNTPNWGLGADYPPYGSEVAFNVLEFGPFYTYVSDTYTSYREREVRVRPSVLAPLASSRTVIHTHQTPAKNVRSGLSPADQSVADSGINVVAVEPDGSTFCAAGNQGEGG